MKHQRELRYVAKMRESCVCVDSISLCDESKFNESMIGIVVNQI